MIAFLVVSHRNPEQVLRLVRVLREADDTVVVVRHDTRLCSLDERAVEEAGGELLRDRHDAAWGSAGYTDMLLGAIEHLHRRYDPDWIVTLSGQDYPLRPVSDLVGLLAESPHDALLFDSWQLDLGGPPPTPPRDEFYRRYRYRHYRVPRPAADALSRALGSRAYVRVMPPGLGTLVGLRGGTPLGSCWVSADWLMLGRRAVQSVQSFVASNPAVMRHYRRTVIPAESLFATALASDPAIAVGPAPRVIRFSADAIHPDVFAAVDVDDLLAGGMYLARKFDAETEPAALDRLDEARLAAR